MHFELAEEQATPIEVGDRDGRPVLRLRRGTQVDERLVGELNELTSTGPDREGPMVGRRRPVVEVVVFVSDD